MKCPECGLRMKHLSTHNPKRRNGTKKKGGIGRFQCSKHGVYNMELRPV